VMSAVLVTWNQQMASPWPKSDPNGRPFYTQT